jgi:hypothetical protein
MEAPAEGDFFVRSGPGTVKLSPASARKLETRFGVPNAKQKESGPSDRQT